MEGGSVSTNKMVVRGLAGASAAGKPGASEAEQRWKWPGALGTLQNSHPSPGTVISMFPRLVVRAQSSPKNKS